MAEKIYTVGEINQISIKRIAEDGAIYQDENDNKYVGTSSGTLKFLQTAKETPFTATDFINANNVQEAIESVEIRLSLRTKQVEIDFGSGLNQHQKIFNIVDDNVSVGNKVMASLAYEAPTGKSLDELEMDEIIFKCKANDGSIDLIATSLFGPVRDKFKINYQINY